MTFQQKLFAIIMSTIVLIVIIELVRRRKLAEEYSVLWILTGIVIFLLAVWHDLLLLITRLIGAVDPTTTLFIFGIIFLILINLLYSIKITKLSILVRKLAQHIAIDEERQGKK